MVDGSSHKEFIDYYESKILWSTIIIWRAKTWVI